MSVVKIELSSDDSDDSFRSTQYFYLPKTEVYSVPVESPDSDTSTSASASGISRGSQDNGRQYQPQRKKNVGRLENGGKKKQSVAERQALKKRLAEERKAARDANKIYKPGECMKHMTIEMPPVLFNAWYCADIEREAAACGVKVRACPDICYPSLVLWARTVIPALTVDQGMIGLRPAKERCGRGLCVYHMDYASKAIATRTLAEQMRRAAVLAGCKLTLVIFGVKDYFKCVARKATKNITHIITEVDLEKAITDLLVSADCDTVLANTPSELALTVVHFTKAIAEEPFKKARRDVDEKAQFYMRGDNKNCVAVDKDGNGLSRAWQQMIAVLPLASLESSRALCSRYPTPLSMFEALQSPGGEEEIADIRVSRTALPGSKARRIGPEFARKLKTLFTARDGDMLVD